MIPTMEAFRTPHRIEPVPVHLSGGEGIDHYACDVCGVDIWRINSALVRWRHDARQVARLRLGERPATWPRRVA